MKKPLWMMAPLAIVASLALTVTTAGTASASIPSANQAYGRWINTSHMGHHYFGVFWEPLKGTNKKVLVVCSEPLKPYATVTVGDTSATLPNLKPGGSEAVHTIVNEFMSTVNTADEGEALSLAVDFYSTDSAVQADVPAVLKGASKNVRALYTRYVDFANNHRGPYKETLGVAAVHGTGGRQAQVSVTLKSSNGHGMSGFKPTVSAVNGTVSSVTSTNAKGVATYVVTATAAGMVKTTATFKGLPDWRTVTGGYVAGHQHFSGGTHHVNVTASGSLSWHGPATATIASLCTNDCDTTVPVQLTGNNPSGSDTLRVDAVDTATGQVEGHVDVAPGHSGTGTIQLANGDGKTLQLRWYYVSGGKVVGSVHLVKTIKVVCPPKPNISVTVNCGCASNAATSTVSTLAGAHETYTALFYQNGVLKYSKVLTNGTPFTYTWSTVGVGNSLDTDVTTVDANQVGHKWDREITVNK